MTSKIFNSMNCKMTTTTNRHNFKWFRVIRMMSLKAISRATNLTFRTERNLFSLIPSENLLFIYKMICSIIRQSFFTMSPIIFSATRLYLIAMLTVIPLTCFSLLNRVFWMLSFAGQYLLSMFLIVSFCMCSCVFWIFVGAHNAMYAKKKLINFFSFHALTGGLQK